MTVFNRAALLLASASLAACVSSDDSNTDKDPGPKPPAATGPASTSVPDLKTWAAIGTTSTEISRTPDAETKAGVFQRDRSVVIDGQTVHVRVLEDAHGAAMVAYSDGTQILYQAAHANLSPNDTPTGHYVGRADAHYRISEDGPIHYGRGDASISVNAVTGVVGYGFGIFGEDSNVDVHIYGDAELDPATDLFSSYPDAYNTSIRVDGLVEKNGRANVVGGFFGDAAGGNQAVLGTITSDDLASEIWIRGGFIATPRPE